MAKSLSKNQQICLSLIREMLGDTRTGIIPLRLFNEKLKPLLFPDLYETNRYVVYRAFRVGWIDGEYKPDVYKKVRVSVSRTLKRLSERGYIEIQKHYIRVKCIG